MIPGDVQLFESKDLFLSESALTGESIPVEKYVMTQRQIDNWRKENGITPPGNVSNHGRDDEGSSEVVVDVGADDHMHESVSIQPESRRSLEMRRSIDEARRNSIDLKANSKSIAVADKITKKMQSGELHRPDFCLMGTSVVSGTAKGTTITNSDKH